MEKPFDDGVFFQSEQLTVNEKGQLTLPEEYCLRLGIEGMVECILQKDHLILRPLRENGEKAYYEELFEELIKDPEEDTSALGFTSIGDIFGSKEE